MKIIQIVPLPGKNLINALKAKERELRGKGTFRQEKKGKWKHVRFAGSIGMSKAEGGIVVAKVQTKEEGSEWQILQAFIGFLDRHFSEIISSVSIFNR